MGTAAWVIVLGGGGGLAQIVGLFLVIADVLADRRHAAAIRVERPRRERVDWKSMYLRVHGSQIAASVKGRPIEDQLRLIAERVDNIESRMTEGLATVHRECDNALDEALDEVGDEVRNVNDDLQEHIHKILTSNSNRRIVGAVLIIFGIALSAVATVVGAIAAG
jgi:hypothetical protein